VIIIDASALLDALLWDSVARERLAGELLGAPHLIDAEFMSAVRWHVMRGRLGMAEAREVLDDFADLDLLRYEHLGLMDRVWALRDNLTPYDALYVALAEWHDEPLVTTDARLAKAPGIRARVEVLPVAS
jgi:predicted nucleic acid-binding protein